MAKNRLAQLGLAAIFLMGLAALAALAHAQDPGPLAALGTAFTYQGNLRRDGTAFSGTCAMTFRLYDASGGGTLMGTVSNPTVPISNSLFTVGLDFGANAFPGDRRWLEIDVNCPGDSGATTLPRQELTAVPYALTSVSTMGLQGRPVSNTAPAAGQVLQWSGTTWSPTAVVSGAHTHWGQTWTGSGTGLTLGGGNVGLSASGTLTGVQGAGGSYGVYGTGTAAGVAGQGGSYAGVYGYGAPTGVYGNGTTIGVTGMGGPTGVYGYGGTYGVYGSSPTTAIYGAGGNYGVKGQGVVSGVVGLGPTGLYGGGGSYGVYGQGVVTGVVGIGRTGMHGQGSNMGVLGEGGNYGVFGSSDTYGVVGNGGSNGVYGAGYIYGVYGYGIGSNSLGVRADGKAYGLLAAAPSPGYAGRFDGNVIVNGNLTINGNGSHIGLYGLGGDYGVYGTGSVTGVVGLGGPTGVYGNGTDHGVDGYGATGVYGQGTAYGMIATGPIGLYATGTTWAGYFNGNVTKAGGSFRIDHPLDPAGKYLSHSFVESPDMKNVYDGVATLGADGTAWVTLPDWFQALNRDFRYQLTCLGRFAPVYVAQEIQGNRFQIAGGSAGQKVSWQVTGIRQDAWANAHRIPVEEAKPAAEAGTYLHPELFGQPASAGLDARLKVGDR